MVSYLGCAISLICLLFTIIMLLFYRYVKDHVFTCYKIGTVQKGKASISTQSILARVNNTLFIIINS